MSPPRLLASFRAAIGFLTILPVSPRDAASPPDAAGALARAPAWFPAVGLLLGAMLAFLDLALRALHLPVLLNSALLLATLAALTRALHLDGFMDTCDALLGGFDRERRLAILRDPHVGAFAVVGVVCLLLVKLAALTALPGGYRTGVLILFPCLSRAAMVLAMEWFPYARHEGLGTPFASDDGRRPRAGPLLAAAVAQAQTGLPGLALAALAAAVAGAGR
ncbi:MAG: adenosylcobinamide-GDP ribazoletransferase, partial [Spirochaetaceae bacterium]|nr:adenosylcobinamide-GDP ribazoletransferase [Spirochaetaceae bacterium]